MTSSIDAIRRRLGRRLLILGHHYQRDDVLAHADLVGDSFQLSAAAAENLDCETIIFCGVHFMAETADILANSRENVDRRGGRRVNVLLPDLSAGCSMADMATGEAVERCFRELAAVIDVDEITPVTYVNSTAELKAFCGRNGGSACTSTNARGVLDWALARTKRVLFFPDRHLGRNTALAMGIPDAAMPIWTDGPAPLGGNTGQAIRDARLILWNGYCSVHQKFRAEHVERMRRLYPDIRVIVHPECDRAVVQAADEAGSTGLILDRITESPDGSKWAVGTESRFVERLARDNPGKTVLNLSEEPSYCETMGLTDPSKLAAVAASIETGTPKNVIRVPDAVAADALLCLERMLACP